MFVSGKSKSDKHEAIVFALKINLSVVLAIDFVYFLLKATVQIAFEIESVVIELITIYFLLLSILYVVLLIGDKKTINNISLSARKILCNDQLFRYPEYAFYIIMIPCSVIFGISSVLYRKIIEETAISKWEILILFTFTMFLMIIVNRKIFSFIYKPK